MTARLLVHAATVVPARRLVATGYLTGVVACTVHGRDAVTVDGACILCGAPQ